MLLLHCMPTSERDDGTLLEKMAPTCTPSQCREPKPSGKPRRSASEVFYEPADILPSHGSIPSVRALDPQIEKARQEMERDSQQEPLVSGEGPSSSAPGSPVDTPIPVIMVPGAFHCACKVHARPLADTTIFRTGVIWQCMTPIACPKCRVA